MNKIQAAPPTVAARALATIARVVGDVAHTPSNLKFQKLSFENSKLNSILWLVDGTFDLLTAAGFERGVDGMVLGVVDVALLQSLEAWILTLPICEKVKPVVRVGTVGRRTGTVGGRSAGAGAGAGAGGGVGAGCGWPRKSSAAPPHHSALRRDVAVVGWGLGAAECGRFSKIVTRWCHISTWNTETQGRRIHRRGAG